MLPAEFRKQDRIHPGQSFDVERVDAGQYLIKRQLVGNNEGLVDWLLSCPEQDWFQGISSESTDTL